MIYYLIEHKESKEIFVIAYFENEKDKALRLQKKFKAGGEFEMREVSEKEYTFYLHAQCHGMG